MRWIYSGVLELYVAVVAGGVCCGFPVAAATLAYVVCVLMFDGGVSVSMGGVLLRCSTDLAIFLEDSTMVPAKSDRAASLSMAVFIVVVNCCMEVVVFAIFVTSDWRVVAAVEILSVSTA